MATLRPVGSKSNQALLNAECKIAPIIPDSRCLQTFEMQSTKKALAIHLFRYGDLTDNCFYLVTDDDFFKSSSNTNLTTYHWVSP